MNDALLHRIAAEEQQTLGYFYFPRLGFMCHTLELPWEDNQQNISCIPNGSYVVQARYSERYGDHFHVTGVPNRSMILFHYGNYYSNTEGCILVGDKHTDIDGDGWRDVTNSRNTMEAMVHALPERFVVDVVWDRGAW